MDHGGGERVSDAAAAELGRALAAALGEYLEHQTWRCYTTRYPGQCLCGLDAVLDKLGMGDAKDTDDPTWRSFT